VLKIGVFLMNISPVNFCKPNLIDVSNNRANQDIFFRGLKHLSTGNTAKNVKQAGVLAGVGLLGVIFSPLILLDMIFSKNKQDKINGYIRSMRTYYPARDEYGKVYLNDFKNDVNELNKCIRENVKNNNYADFVKDATEFLLMNFKNNPGSRSNIERLEAFQQPSEAENIGYFQKFMNTISKAAEASISKNGKNIDFEKLDKDVQWAKELMQQKTSVN
ncbi:MAG: hypothetical protein MJ231_05765, partial [bacterium]|nr:hypothetical protein [bacterium]